MQANPAAGESKHRHEIDAADAGANDRDRLSLATRCQSGLPLDG
jgi:hypothetical protein